MRDNPETTTSVSLAPTSGTGSRPTTSTNSLWRGYGASRQGYCSGYGNRGEQSILSVKQDDRDFKGKKE